MGTDDTDDDVNDALPLETVGARLNRARVEKGRSLADIAATTRIPEHYLAAIEDQRFADLPARTYVFGFTRSFAREVGLDPEAMLSDLHAEFDHRPEVRAPALSPAIGDRAEAPSARVAWIAAFAALVVVIAALVVWRGDDLFDSARGWLPFAPGATSPSSPAPTPAPPPPTEAMPTTAASTPDAQTSDSASGPPAPLAAPSEAASDAGPSPAPRHHPRKANRRPEDDMGPGPVINPPSAAHSGVDALSAAPPVNAPPVNAPPAASAPATPSPTPPAAKPSAVSQ